ncbi:energy-coupling factor ABC transporter ATP-binding protein [Rhodococcus qingshengii]|uniref:energy-coupling factor ABC transporter ATP-binding protein n=1 Tax=Rhodococcus qingshengii TaxID=334542 RepID=UPI001C5D9BC1|nr:ATP-binding cassette domain-containing protein [Rhodococcus qingshengii]MBW4818791.1 ATP-binding cassette domain-containing protein [Rhodococcus qingshengii]
MSHRSLCGRGLAFSYLSDIVPLVDVDLSIAPATRVALLGANGSGKTTLLRILAGSLKPARGLVEVDGVPLRHDRTGLRAHRQTVQLVLQNPDDQLFSADVAHDIAFGPANLGLDRTEIRERVRDAMTLLSIASLADRPTHELSYGERKRVTIAGAMAMRPCVLLLDEPTAGLDPAGVEEMFAALERLEAGGTTVVLSTHDTALAFGWADSVAVLQGGTVVQGTPVETFHQRDLLEQARLRAPWPIELMDELRRRGFDQQPTTVPRDAAEFAHWILDTVVNNDPVRSASSEEARFSGGHSIDRPFSAAARGDE